MIAHFPRGRPTYTTKALVRHHIPCIYHVGDQCAICTQVGMTQIARDQAQIIAPKIYGYYDNVPNPINAEVVLLELVRASSFPLSYIVA